MNPRIHGLDLVPGDLHRGVMLRGQRHCFIHCQRTRLGVRDSAADQRDQQCCRNRTKLGIGLGIGLESA
jgi:hypothetical protein